MSEEHGSLFDIIESVDFNEDTNLKTTRCSVSWKIEKFSRLPSNRSYRISSPPFKCYDSMWTLELYPGGGITMDEEHEESISIYLINLPPKVKNNLKVKVWLKQHVFFGIYVHECEWRYSNKNNSTPDSVGWTDFAKRSSLITSNFLRSDILIVHCELENLCATNKTQFTSKILSEETTSVSPNVGNIQQKTVNLERLLKRKNKRKDRNIQNLNDLKRVEFLEILSNDLAALLNDSRNCDVVLQVGDKKFPAHKVLLGARSNVFAAMFEHDLKESHSNVVTISDLDTTVVEDLLRYIYSGSVNIMSAEAAMGLYASADKYLLQALKEYCAEYLTRNVVLENACDIALFADVYNDGMLIDSLKKFVSENPSLLSTEKWKRLATQNVHLAYEIILASALKK